MTSIRSRLTRILLWGLILLYLVCGTLLYFSIRIRLIRQFDATLETQARFFASLTEQTEDRIEMDFADENEPLSLLRKPDEYFQCWLAGGDVLARSASLGNQDMPRQTGSFEDPVYYNYQLTDGRPVRVIGVRFSPRREQDDEDENRTQQLELAVARDRSSLDKSLMIVLSGLIATGFILAIGTNILLRIGVRAGLQPLSQLASEAAEIDAARLAARFPHEEMPLELRPITEQLNALLDRLEDAFRREKRLTGDMAHELRTPIAELRTVTEVALRWPDDCEQAQSALKDAHDIALQMERLVQVFLELARTEIKQDLIKLEQVDLREVMVNAWRPFEEQSKEKGIQVELAQNGSVTIQTDRILLQSILRNLFSNAVECTPAGGHITGQMKENAESVDIVLTNTNNNLTSADLPHIFEPLWRKDPARTGNGHLGLGLTLVRNFTQILGGEVQSRLIENGDFEITIRLKSD